MEDLPGSSMFEQSRLDYREFPHFGVRNSLEPQTEQCAARLRRGKSISRAGQLTSDCAKRVLNSLVFSYRKEISGAVLDGARPRQPKRLLFTSGRGVWRRGEHVSPVAAPDDGWIRL